MKKTIALFLTVILILLCFTSCGKSGTETIKTKIGGVKTSIEYKSTILDFRQDLIVLNLKMTGRKEYNKVRILVQYQYNYADGGIIPGMTICTPDTEWQRGDFSAEYDFDGELETSIIINPDRDGGYATDYDDVWGQKIKIGLFLVGDSDEVYCEESIYVTGDFRNALFLSKNEDLVKYRAINSAIDHKDFHDGSKLVALWLFLTGQL